MSKGQTKKTREAAGNRRKLTRAEKKQIAAVIRQAKGWCGIKKVDSLFSRIS